MDTSGKKPSESLRTGIKVAASLENVSLASHPFHIEGKASWAVPVTVRMRSTSEYVPTESKWIILVEETYPFGDIEFFPATAGGMEATFPHQEQNGSGPDGRAWRNGKLCLDNPIERLSVVSGPHDPVGNADERLCWYVRRAQEWLRLAVEGSLMSPGDPFELPWCGAKIDKWRLVHDESSRTFPTWAKMKKSAWGVIVLGDLPEFNNATCVVAFEDNNGTQIRIGPRYQANKHASDISDRKLGFWLFFPQPPILAPWHFPRTWGELRSAGKLQKADIDQVFKVIAGRVRGEEAYLVLLGYPIPLKCGESACEVHWQGLELPALKAGGKPPQGFRPNETGWWMRDRRSTLGDDKEIKYVKTENWSSERLLARGGLSEGLKSLRIALLGCGALGSTIAELLVRGGAQSLLLLDNDKLAAGNLVRHTLTGADIGREKANALADRLRSVNPHVVIRAETGDVPVGKKELEELLEEYGAVLDCTAVADVPQLLSHAWWSVPRLFLSASTGFKAMRTFAFLCFGNTFDVSGFLDRINPWLDKEREHWSEQGETLEGPGCWSPLFPARFDDVFLAAVTCVKSLEEYVANRKTDSELLVYEQSLVDGRFAGLRRIDEPKDTGCENENARNES